MTYTLSESIAGGRLLIVVRGLALGFRRLCKGVRNNVEVFGYLVESEEDGERIGFKKSRTWLLFVLVRQRLT